MASCRTFLCRGGNSGVAGQPPLDNPHRMQKGKTVGILIGLQGRLVHQAPDREVGHQQAPELLFDQLRRLAPQHDLSATQVRFQLVERGLSGKGLARCADVRPVSSPSP
jgi:hypothetical protein